MSNGSPALAAAASTGGGGGGGGGIAFLRRQFELRVDADYEAPLKPLVRKRPVSLRDPKTVYPRLPPNAQPLKPRPREASSLSELTEGPSSAPSTSFVSNSSSASSLISQSVVDAAAADGCQATEQDANDQKLPDIQETGDEGTPISFIVHPPGADLTTTSDFHPSDVDTSKDLNESHAEFMNVELNDKLKVEDTSARFALIPSSDSSGETNSDASCLKPNVGEFRIGSTPVCSLSELESSGGIAKTAVSVENDAQNATQAEDNGAERSLPAETLSAPKSPSLPSNATPRKKWMPAARSMENLCSPSAEAAVTPTKDLDSFCKKKPNAVNTLLTANAADVVTSSQSLDRSTSLANKAMPPVRAKKPPPPVPKKTVKFTGATKPCRAVEDEAKKNSNTDTTSSEVKAQPLSSDGDVPSMPSEAPTRSDGDQNQRSVSVPSLGAQTKTAVPRPKTLFPPLEVMAVRNATESNHDRYKSLPTLSHLQANGAGRSPICNRKDTLFPSSRQKLRPNVLLQSALTPDFCQRNSIGDSHLLLDSPMSLGCRTPPDVDFTIENTGECLSDGERQSSPVPPDCPLPTPDDSEACHASKVASDSVLPSSNTDGETLDAACAAEQQTPGVHRFSEISDADSFLEDAFDFLGDDAQPIDDGANTSPLKMWTETWCKSSTRNQNEIPLRALVTGSKASDGQKGDARSTKEGDRELDRTAEKRRLQTVKKTEENGQRTATEDGQIMTRKGSFALGGSLKTPRDSTEAAAVAVECPTKQLFGVALRPNSIRSLSRRSTFVSSAIQDTDALSLSSPTAAAASGSNRRSSVILRGSSDARPLSRLPSLTILPSNRPTAKVPGKYVGGKPFIFLDGPSPIEEDRKTNLETELSAIDDAFDFLEDTGA